MKKLICFMILLIFPALALGKDLPRGKWWQDPKLSSIIKVSEAEKQKLDALYIESRRNLIQLKSAVQLERFELEVLMEKDPLDEAKVLEQYRKMDSARDSLGTERFRFLLEVRKLLGRRLESTAEVTAYEPNAKIAFKSTSGPVQYEAWYIFEPVDAGTKLTIVGEAETGGFFKLAEGLVVRQFEKEMQTALAALKDILEAQA